MPRRDPASGAFARNAKALRKAAGLTQPQVAKTALEKGFRIDQGTISRIERGALIPTLDVAEALAVGLDSELWQLFVPGYEAKNPPMLAKVAEEQQELFKRLQQAFKALTPV